MTQLQYISLGMVILTVTMDRSSTEEKRPHIRIRGIYGGVPTELLDRDTLLDYGVNAILMGSDSVNAERLARLKKQGAQVFIEFNTMHRPVPAPNEDGIA